MFLFKPYLLHKDHNSEGIVLGKKNVSDFPMIFYNYLEYLMWATQVIFFKVLQLDTDKQGYLIYVSNWNVLLIHFLKRTLHLRNIGLNVGLGLQNPGDNRSRRHTAVS